MTTIYDWPEDFGVNMFEMRVAHNTRVFTSPFTGSAQVLNYTGERWQATIGLVPGISVRQGARLEAFFDRLAGPSNRIRMWNLRRPQPLGTLRDGVSINVVNGSSTVIGVTNGSGTSIGATSGTPVLLSAVASGAGAATIVTVPGRTLLAGDHIGLPNGQNVRQVSDTVADANGLMSIEFQPRARAELSIGVPIVWNKPTSVFMLKADGVPISWRPGRFEGTSAELIEAP